MNTSSSSPPRAADMSLPNPFITSNTSMPTTPVVPTSPLGAFKKANPPFYKGFHLHYLCSCGKHLTSGPKTSIRITIDCSACDNTDVLINRFRVTSGTTLKFGDRSSGRIVPDYGGLKGKNGPVKVVLNTGGNEIIHCKKNPKKEEIKIWIDEEESQEHYDLSSDREDILVADYHCGACVQKEQDRLNGEWDSEGFKTPRGEEEAINEDFDHQEAQNLAGEALEEIGQESEDLEYETETEEEDGEESDEEPEDEERVWTSPPEHANPTPAPQVPPVSRIPSEEDWRRAAKRMRMLR